jgi:folate-dependent phosphoribosylglycinamide formyltransferase PurN
MLNVGILCSHRAPGIEALLWSAAAPASAFAPNRATRAAAGAAALQRDFNIACVVSTEQTIPQRAALEAAGVPFIARTHPPRRLDAREEFDAVTMALLREFDVDLVILCGYLYILTRPMLRAFRRRIINIHDSDLTIKRPDGTPRYAGLRSTRDAIFAGERETRATVHYVEDRVDAGEILFRSKPFPVSPLVRDALSWGDLDIVKAYAYAHREWVIRSSWAALMTDAIGMLSEAVA